MMTLKQSVSWWCFANRGVEDVALLRGIQRIGYKAVELIVADKFRMAQDAGLCIASHGGHDSIERGLNDIREHDRIEMEVKAGLDLARAYDIPNLIVFSGNRREGLTDEEGLANTVLGLRRLAPAAEEARVTLIVELLNSRVDHPGYQCDHTAWGVRVSDAVASPCVKLLYDIYHMQIMEGDLIRTIQNHHVHFAHYHTAGNPGRRDLDETQEIGYPPIFRAIAETGYAGYVGHEFIPKGDPLRALEAAYRLTDVSTPPE